MTNQPKKDKKPIYKTTVKAYDGLCEMVYDEKKNRTYFVTLDSSGVIGERDQIAVDEEIFKPLPPNHMLVQKRVVLFPSKLEDYKDEQEIINEVQSFIHKYLDISEVYEGIATYYVLFSWLYDKFNEVPYLRTIGDYGTGKSRFLQTIGSLCYKPIFTGGATTPSPIFRIVDETGGTLIIDEADFKYSDMTSDLVKILNTGYQKGIPVLRTEGKGTYEVKAYNVFSPKIVATRETFSDKALESRFLVEEMSVGTIRAGIPRTLEEDFYNDSQKIRNKLLRWRLDNYLKKIDKNDEQLIEGIHPRLNQIVLPLFSIIKDPQTKQTLKDFIVKYNVDLVADRGLSWESDIIFAILKIQHDEIKNEMSVKEITNMANFETDENDHITARKTGWYLRSKLQLKTEKKRNGFILSIPRNKDKLLFWKERFGITDSEIKGELVNDVNIAEVPSTPITENLGFSTR
ncbi:MAG: hypothetical protein V4664_00845 [Patescibacteria group bacterium]